MNFIIVSTVYLDKSLKYEKQPAGKIDLYRYNVVGTYPGAWKLTGNFNKNISASQLKDMAMERKAKHKKAMVERLNCMDARISTLKPNQRKSFYNFLLTLD